MNSDSLFDFRIHFAEHPFILLPRAQRRRGHVPSRAERGVEASVVTKMLLAPCARPRVERDARVCGRSWRLMAGLSLVLAGCADGRARPTFPIDAAGQDLLEEQALLGFNAAGDALVAQLVAAEGSTPVLQLLAFARDGGPSQRLAVAPEGIARAVAGRLLRDGARPEPLLAAALGALWPEAPGAMSAAGFSPAPPATPDPGMGRWPVRGAGLLPLALRIAAPLSGPPAALLMLAEAPGRAMDNEEVELTRMPLVGTQVPPLLWISGSNAWLIAGSVLAVRGEPLHRSVGVRRASLGRGEAMLHNQHGLADYGAGELDAARREFDRALLADPRFVDALYNAASVAALEDRPEAAVALLQRAAAEDSRRVQVLGRDDDDLKNLRKRPDVRALLGLVRMPPGE